MYVRERKSRERGRENERERQAERERNGERYILDFRCRVMNYFYKTTFYSYSWGFHNKAKAKS